MRSLPASEQLVLALEAPAPARWRFSRLVERSPHLPRMLRRLEFVRRHFPELDGTCIRVGLAQKRGVLGWGSLDPEQPGIWVRPRRLDYFTIAHELTHLLQARGQVPRGERACDLHALARSPVLVDVAPGYLKVPEAWRGDAALPAGAGAELCRAARAALAARAGGRRDYLRAFERALRRMDAPPVAEDNGRAKARRPRPRDGQEGSAVAAHTPEHARAHHPRHRVRLVQVAAAVVRDGGRVLLTQRPPTGAHRLQWELPGGKIEPGESPEHAVVRELREELGVTVRPRCVLAVETHDYPDGPEVEIHFLECELEPGEFRCSAAVHAVRWAVPAELGLTDLLAADRRFLESLYGARLV